MGVFAMIVFALSLLGIVSLFVLKAIEVRRDVVYAQDLRVRADEHALRLKSYLLNSRIQASKIIPLLGVLSRYFIHEAALAFASSAHIAARYAHRIADRVSHRHNFERQAPRSEFLKQVSLANSRTAGDFATTIIDHPSIEIPHREYPALESTRPQVQRFDVPTPNVVELPEPQPVFRLDAGTRSPEPSHTYGFVTEVADYSPQETPDDHIHRGTIPSKKAAKKAAKKAKKPARGKTKKRINAPASSLRHGIARHFDEQF